MRNNLMQIARNCVEEKYPDAEFALLCGSAASGTMTTSSDLDLVVWDDTEPHPFRHSFYFENWPVEGFVLTSRSYIHFFEEAVQTANPTLLRMLAEGKPVKESERMHQLKTEAQQLLEEGPDPCSLAELDQMRYQISELLEDFEAVESREDGIFITHPLISLVPRFILRRSDCWLGEGKWLGREFKTYDHQLYQQFTRAVSAYYEKNDKTHLITFIDQVLDPSGGRFFEGYNAVRFI